jgi:hypothetical protein
MVSESGKSQQTVTLDTRLLRTVIKLKEAGTIPSISDFFNDAGYEHLEKSKPVSRQTVLVYIVYPWLISFLLFLWSQHARELIYSAVIFYANLAIFGVTVAATYWFYRKWKDG